jgi:DeoR family transcriptional regulator, fructose operon transcriptional repressor
MLALERQREILAALTSQRSVKVVDLALKFAVAEETIRRDLDKLESLGKLVRSHGGAVATLENEVPHWQREFINQSQKQAIAREAANLVEEGDTLLLDASSSCWFLARRLPDIPLTIITNSLFVCMALEDRVHAKIICPGGTLSQTSMSFVGAITQEALRRYHASKLFVSCRAFDVQRGLSDISDEQALVRRAMLDVSDYHVLLIDSSKWGTRALSMIAAPTEIQCIISDAGLAEADVEPLRRLGIDVQLAEVYSPV